MLTAFQTQTVANLSHTSTGKLLVAYDQTLSLTSFAGEAMQRGISLHIGLNKVSAKAYPPGSVPRLKSAENDARCWRNVATYYFQKIHELIGKAATVAAVTEQISAAADELQAGDLFLLTYSGHGGQVPDNSGDENDDTLDETWVLYDREFLDDELHALLASFKAGVRVLVISDSCHSGTVVIDASRLPRGLNDAQKALIYEQHRVEYTAIQRAAKRDGPAEIKASVLLMAACQDDETAGDGDENGEFTGVLLSIWDQGRFEGSYLDFFQAALDEMPSYQTPNLLRLGPTDQAFETLRPFKVSADQPDPLN